MDGPYFNDSLQASGADLRSECRCRIKEIVDLIPGVVLVQNEGAHKQDYRAASIPALIMAPEDQAYACLATRSFGRRRNTSEGRNLLSPSGLRTVVVS